MGRKQRSWHTAADHIFSVNTDTGGNTAGAVRPADINVGMSVDRLIFETNTD